MIGRGSRRGVEHRAAGPKRERRLRLRAAADRLADERRGLRPLPQLGRVQRLLVAEGREDVLPVAVPVDEQLDAGAVAELAHELVEALVLGRVGGGLAFVGLGARVRGGAEGVRVPGEGPVAVDVAADAGLVAGGRGRLPVLAPEAVGCLRIHEPFSEYLCWLLVVGQLEAGQWLTVRIHYWNNVEIVIIQKRSNKIIAAEIARD